MAVADSLTLAQLLARQGALPASAALVALREVAAAAAAREAVGQPVGALSAEQVLVARTGRMQLVDATSGGEAGGSEAAVPPAPAALARLGIAMLRGGADGTANDTTFPERARTGAVSPPFARAIERGLSGEVVTAAAYAAMLQGVPLRPDERKAALEQLNQMAVRGWTLAPRSGSPAALPAVVARSASAPAWRRWAVIGGLMLATGGAWVEREHLFGASTPEDVGTATLALAKRAQRLRATTDVDSLRPEAPVVDSVAMRDSAAARVAGATTSGSQGGEAEASLAGDPFIEGIKALEAGRTREAIPLLQRAVARDGEDPAPHGYLACAHRRLGEHKEADRALEATGGTPGPWAGCARKVGR